MLADELLAHRLSTALADGRVEPFFQPIVSPDDGHILGFEVLARWDDPVQGFISPERFFPIADRFGLLDRLLDQLMRTAFRAAADWPHSIFLGFNVSPTQLRDAKLATSIAQAATDGSFPLSRVHIEVTESGFIDDLTQPRQTLEQLMSLGCLIDGRFWHRLFQPDLAQHLAILQAQRSTPASSWRWPIIGRVARSSPRWSASATA